MAALIYELESAPNREGAIPTSLDGTWRLLWSSVEPFRSSPFFWAFQDGLVQNRAIAARIFQFTDRACTKSQTLFGQQVLLAEER